MALAALAGALLLSAVLLGQGPRLQAQEGEASLHLNDLSRAPTHTTVDRFTVEVRNLSATAAYEVRVASDRAATLGIDGCGQAVQTRTVTGVTAQTLAFLLYACTEGGGTLTAAVRRVGASRADATVSQRLTVTPLSAGVPGDAVVAGAQAAAAQAAAAQVVVAQVGRPGIVPGVSFSDVTTTSFTVRWDAPSDGGRAITGYGVLQWRDGTNRPPWGSASVVGGRSKTYGGLRPDTTYWVMVHACNGEASCGWWTNKKSVRTKPAPTPRPTRPAPTQRPPGPVRNLTVSAGDGQVAVTWNQPTDSGSSHFTGYHVQHRRAGAGWPVGATVVTPGTTTWHTIRNLTNGQAYDVRVQACNGHSRCGAWRSQSNVAPRGGPAPPPTGPTGTLQPVAIANDPVGSASLTATWSVTRTTGLTRFQVLRRRDPGAYPPVLQAATVAVVDGQTTYHYTYTGLKRDITYRVRVRACTGPNDASDCAGWLESDSVTMPSHIVDSARPGPVRAVSFADRTATSFKVTWDVPTDTGTGITGYGLQHKRGRRTDPWPPTSQVVVVGATPREWTFRGLDAGTHWVRIQACTGKNSCYPWAQTTGHSVTILGDQVQDLRAAAGIGHLVVSWRAPADTGGKTITRYLVQYRIQGVTAWTTWPHTVTSSPVTIDNLRNEATYDVQVRACYRLTTPTVARLPTPAGLHRPACRTSDHCPGRARRRCRLRSAGQLRREPWPRLAISTSFRIPSGARS